VVTRQQDDNIFFAYLNEVVEMTEFGKKDFINQFPIFTGYVNIAKYLALYQLYLKTMNLSGHIADIGTWKGSSLMWFSKLVRIHEPDSMTEVHSFDWYKGMKPGEHDNHINKDKYAGDRELLLKLIHMQDLHEIAFPHNMDLSVEDNISNFFNNNGYLNFKFVFVDCAIYEVLENVIMPFWDRMSKGGIMVFDHFNRPTQPQETISVRNCLSGYELQSSGFCRHPAAYVVKP
jgi:hypothetical protein